MDGTRNLWRGKFYVASGPNFDFYIYHFQIFMSVKKHRLERLFQPLLSGLFFWFVLLSPTTALLAEEGQDALPYKQKFVITAYYSPLPNQTHYFKGDYQAEIRLNGRGTHGASGRPVYPGMIAAPKEYPFGTKMSIPGVGVVAVYDRGGAIKKANGGARPYDRLDIWMGRGEDGLKRSLAWGVRVVEVEVYGLQGPEEKVDLEILTLSDISRYQVGTQNFSADVYYKSSGPEVKKLQEVLLSLGYFKGETNGYYGEETRNSVLRFQIENGIIDDENDFGAGHFGINSRALIDRLLAGQKTARNNTENKSLSENFKKNPSVANSDKFYRSVAQAEKSDYVRDLQVELRRLGFLRIEATGYYGETTQHALFKFQQAKGLIAEKSDAAAGHLGPQTRSELNRIWTEREKTQKLIADKKNSQRHLAQSSLQAESKQEKSAL